MMDRNIAFEINLRRYIMVVAIGLEIGIMDAWMLLALAALTWVTMMLGLVAERVMVVEDKLRELVASAARVGGSGSCSGGGGSGSGRGSALDSFRRLFPRLAAWAI
jgi:hypothetical protein